MKRMSLSLKLAMVVVLLMMDVVDKLSSSSSSLLDDITVSSLFFGCESRHQFFCDRHAAGVRILYIKRTTHGGIDSEC